MGASICKGAEPIIGNRVEQHAGLTEARAGEVLKQRGYEMVCPFEHVHATDGSRQWHLCLVAELASMGPDQLLACLEEALTFTFD
jgi:hypothetical protein